MNVLLIHQHFKLPEEGGGLRTYHLAKAMQQKGWKVHVLSTYQKPRRDEISPGLQIHFFPIPYNNHFGFFQRVLAFLKFVNACKKWIRGSTHQFDFSYVVSTPLTTAWVALFLKKKYNIPYAFEVGDLWPDVPIELGILKNKWLKKYFYALESKAYTQAKALIALSPDIADKIRQKAPTIPIHISTNMSDDSIFSPNERDPNRPFTIGYFGTLGYANDIPFILELARHAPHIRFIIMGEGLYKNEVLNLAKSATNVVVYDWQGTKRVASRLRFCDAVLVSFLPNKILSSGCPNKAFDGLAAGKVIILTFGGWLADLVVREKCGIQIDRENMKSSLSKINGLVDNPLLTLEMKENAFRLGKKSFSVRIITEQWFDFISSRF